MTTHIFCKLLPIAIFAFAIAILPSSTFASHIGTFKQTIKVDIDCSKCKTKPSGDLTVQLFADGQPVEGKTAVINEGTEWKTEFTDLDIFKDIDTPKQIVYGVKVVKDGGYEDLFDEQINYETKTIDAWASVDVADLQEGHKYALFTDNWNYNAEGAEHTNKYVLVDGDMHLIEADADGDYKFIDGKPSYFNLTTSVPNGIE